jgi:murein tripeptide amidase MpaA
MYSIDFFFICFKLLIVQKFIKIGDEYSLRIRSIVLFGLLLAFFITADNTKAASKHDIVKPVQTYTYEEMVTDIKKLAATYPEVVRYKVIGQSEYGRNIYAVGLGNGEASVYFDGSHHGREWLTTNLNMYMINKYAQFYQLRYNLDHYNVRETLDKTTIWFVPMVNPDGVTLQQKGLSAFPKSTHASLIQMNSGSTNFKRWKANGKGVDLNRQYDADWENIWYNTGKPSYKNYKGTAPMQAKETKTIVNFIYHIDPEIAVTYHSAGKILYWNFHQTDEFYSRDLAYALQLNSLTGYSLVKPTPNPSGGGLSDWFVIAFNRPGFTPEIGNYPGETNLPISEFNQTWKENRLVGLYVATEGYKLSQERKKNNNEVDVVINGVKTNFDQPAILMNYRTMVPVRGVFEKLGASLNWNNTTKTAVIKKDDTIVSLTVGKKTATVNGQTYTLDAPATTINSRTLIPLRFVGEAIGASVKWDSATRTAYIKSQEQSEAEPDPVPEEDTNTGNETIVDIIIKDEKIDLTPEARIKNSTTIAPLVNLLNNQDAQYKWDNGSLVVSFNEIHMVLTKDSKTAVVNGKDVSLPTTVEVIEGRTMVPVYLVAGILNWELAWDGVNKTLTIIKPEETIPAGLEETPASSEDEQLTEEYEKVAPAGEDTNNDPGSPAVLEEGQPDDDPTDETSSYDKKESTEQPVEKYPDNQEIEQQSTTDDNNSSSLPAE